MMKMVVAMAIWMLTTARLALGVKLIPMSLMRCQLNRSMQHGLPPEKWSSLKYGLWPDGGLKNAEEKNYG